MKIPTSVLFVFVSCLSSIASGAELSRRDQIQLAVQKICPVSGERLGEHGQPTKVRVGKETVFLCCMGCVQGKVKPQHWATIHANFARAQRICPVMKHKLPKSPKWTIVKGRIIYVCCPPCTEKITADPETYLRQVDKLYEASLKADRFYEASLKNDEDLR